MRCTTFGEPEGLRGPSQTAVEIVVADTGCGISPTKLENIYKEFEQAESSELKTGGDTGVGELCGPFSSCGGGLILDRTRAWPGCGIPDCSATRWPLAGRIERRRREPIFVPHPSHEIRRWPPGTSEQRFDWLLTPQNRD